MIKLANCFYNIAILYRIIYMDFSTNLKGFYQMLVLYCLRTVKNLMPLPTLSWQWQSGRLRELVWWECQPGAASDWLTLINDRRVAAAQYKQWMLCQAGPGYRTDRLASWVNSATFHLSLYTSWQMLAVCDSPWWGPFNKVKKSPGRPCDVCFINKSCLVVDVDIIKFLTLIDW